MLQENYYINTRSGAQKAGITVGKVHGHDKPLLPHMKPEKVGRIISMLPRSSPLNQSQLVTNILIRRALGGAEFKMKVPGTYQLFNLEKFSINSD